MRSLRTRGCQPLTPRQRSEKRSWPRDPGRLEGLSGAADPEWTAMSSPGRFERDRRAGGEEHSPRETIPLTAGPNALAGRLMRPPPREGRQGPVAECDFEKVLRCLAMPRSTFLREGSGSAPGWSCRSMQARYRPLPSCHGNPTSSGIGREPPRSRSRSDCLPIRRHPRSASAAWSWKTVSRARSIHRRARRGHRPARARHRRVRLCVLREVKAGVSPIGSGDGLRPSIRPLAQWPD